MTPFPDSKSDASGAQIFVSQLRKKANTQITTIFPGEHDKSGLEAVGQRMGEIVSQICFFLV